MKKLLQLNNIMPLLVVLPVVWFLIWGGMNYTGFCWAETRWLSDQERIDITIKEFAGITKRTIWDGVDGTREYDLVPYSSKEYFMKKNPECCRVFRVGVYSMMNFFRRITGAESGVVVDFSHYQYYQFNGKIYKKLSMIESDPKYQSNCGKIVTYRYDETND